MHNNLASRLLNIAPFHVMELAKMAAELEKKGRNIIHMGIGEPDFTAPQVVIDAAARAMQNGNLQYTSALGLQDLRVAISDYYLEYYKLTVPASRIVVTAGASAALLLACAALVDPGAEVLMPDPCYPCNRHFVAAFEGVARLVECGPEVGFQLTNELVQKHWT
ncbi:MAG: aminotransferase class I/II-fold pyridoxal phosphate-dependent enzyme, partial [Burkholderiales bacterium]|nr:aminotransferase class I/II-fold pyridoxal phosphate-dependent enzyme [Burkholderiales bacterium]